MTDKNLLNFYKKKYGLTKITKKMKQKANMKEYKVRVETGDKKGSGTEARVFITLFGSKGKSAKKRIFKFSGNAQQDTDLVPFKFARGSAHTFNMTFKNVGVLEKILIEHDGYEEANSWFLNFISITPEESPDTFVFNCEKWLRFGLKFLISYKIKISTFNFFNLISVYIEVTVKSLASFYP